MVRVLKLKRADAAHDPAEQGVGRESLRRICAYIEAIGACLLLGILAITLL